MRTGRAMPISGFARAAVAVVVVCVSLGAAPAVAQETGAGSPRRMEVEGVVGFSTFIDENFIEHLVAGGAVRLPVARRWSIEQEFLYMRSGARDQDFYVLGNLIYDLRTRGPVTPYWIIGGGVFWHRATFGRPRPQVFTGRSWTFAGGAGMRVRLAERWSLTSEARFGFEPFFQVNGGLAYAF